MYRDMTRGSITRGLLLFALPKAAEDPCGAGLCAGGAGGRQRHLGRYPYRLVSGGRGGVSLLPEGKEENFVKNPCKVWTWQKIYYMID